MVKIFSNGHEVIGWDREEIDITEVESLKLKVKNLKPDLVVNAAAYNNVDGAEAQAEIAENINGYAVGYLATTCKELNIPLVHYSTNYVFDGTKKDGYREDDEPSPVSAYGRSKYLGEQELQKNTDKFYLVRTTRLFGQEAASAVGKKSFVSLMLDLARTRDTLEVVDEELCNATYASDLAAQTKYVVENKLPYEIYHVTNDGSCTWYGFAEAIFKIKNISVKLIPVASSRFPRPAKRPDYGVLLNTKLPKLRSWQEALTEFLTS